jgi:hypothetical protein
LIRDLLIEKEVTLIEGLADCLTLVVSKGEGFKIFLEPSPLERAGRGQKKALSIFTGKGLR